MKKVYLIMALCAALAACARTRPVVKPVPPVPVPTHISLVDLVDMVNDSYGGVERFKGSFEMTVAGLNVRGPKRCEGRIALERPGKLRVKAYRALGPSLFDIVADGDRYWVHVPSEGKVYTGKMTARLPQDSITTGLSPSEIIDALAPRRIRLDDPSITVFLERGQGFYILYLLQKIGEHLDLRQKIWLRQLDLSVARRQLFDDEGGLSLEILPSDFELFEGVRFPTTVTLYRYGPGQEISVVLEFRKVEMNVSLNPELFAFSAPRQAEVVQIDDSDGALKR